MAKIGVESFWDPDKLLGSLGHESKYEVTEKSTRFGVKNILGRDSKNTNSEPSVENILRDGKDPLLLILDEAQALGDEDIPPSQYKAAAIQVIELIHNGELGRPIILLATGLDGARRGFSNLKVSRFARNCFVELGASSKESERAVIQDWLQKEGGAKGDPTEWTDAITQETHGWPHHILSYAYLLQSI